MNKLFLCIPLGALLFSGCASTRSADTEAPPAAATDETTAVGTEIADYEDPYADDYEVAEAFDPLRPLNQAIFAFNDAAYTYVLDPVGDGYSFVMPDPAEKGISNFFENLGYPVRLVGNVLQWRWERAGRETQRFLLNSTVGVLGFGKPSENYESLRVPEEDVGQAFGLWGIDPGPYLVLPILGPTNLRDLVGRVGETFLNPVGYVEEWEIEWALRGTELINNLPPTMDNYFQIVEASIDPYTAIREGYSERRKAQVDQ